MFKAYGLYSHIQANRTRSVLLLAGFVVLLIALMFSFALIFEAMGQDAPLDVILARAILDVKQGWPLAFGAAGVWFCIAYLFHQNMIDYATGSAGIERAQAPRLYNLLENLCISRGIPIPRLKIIEDGALNAFASGLRDGNYSISVTRGLLDHLTDAEVELVLGHELTHIRNRDTQMMVIATIFAGIFAFAADLTFRSWNFPYGFSPRRDELREDRSGGGGRHRHSDRAGRHRAELWRLGADPLRPVALARISRRRGLGRTDQKSRRDDLGAAQDLRQCDDPRHALAHAGVLHREPGAAPREWLARDAPADRGSHRRAGGIRRRPRPTGPHVGRSAADAILPAAGRRTKRAAAAGTVGVIHFLRMAPAFASLRHAAGWYICSADREATPSSAATASTARCATARSTRPSEEKYGPM